jgi:hypothetical protein
VELTEKQLDAFFKAAASLKLFSRAELNDEKNRSLIEKLYVDPLPNDQAFKTLLGDSTTFIVGRKGTGKSTVFQRVQHEIRKNKHNIISAYMDIRNVYESSQVDIGTLEKLELHPEAMTPEQVQRLLLYKRFFRTLILDIRNELKTQVEANFLTKLRDQIKGTSSEVFAGLDKLIANLNEPTFESVEGLVAVSSQRSSSAARKAKSSAGLELSASPVGPSAKTNVNTKLENEQTSGSQDQYAQILMRVIGINDIMEQMRRILTALDIKYLYIFLDDFSELPEEPMRLLVDSLISPLTRWSDFIKFKIAAYPGRVYLGSLDKTKIEEFHLDTYGLYGASGVTKMEEKAIDYVKRVVTRRLSHFCKLGPEVYFDTSSEELWRVLFYATMANPRILGHIMLYAYESNLLYGKKIGRLAVQEASQRYYEDKVSSFFTVGKYRMSFHERSSIFSLKELLESIASRARAIRQEDRHRDTGRRGRVFSSHFYVSDDFDDLLTTLELSFFITKYFEQSDRAGTRVSIYALNHGLCQKYQIGFGRPADRREDRLYFVERMFDYNAVLRSYVNENQEIRCNSCNAEFELSMMPALKMLHMNCPKCQSGICQVANLSRKYGELLEAIRPELLLPETELGILQTLHNEDRVMVAAEIAGELDCSGQLVGRRAKNLAERALVSREPGGAVYEYQITPAAEAAYFADAEDAELNLDS